MSQRTSASRLKAFANASPYLPWLLLGMTTLAQAGSHLGMNATSPVSPLIQADLGITRAQIGLLASIMSGGALFTLIVAGWISDRSGARLLMGLGPVITGLFLIMASREGDYWRMVMAIFLSGLGVGFTSPATTKAVVSWFGPATRGTAMGIKQMGTSLGAMAAATILPAIALAIGWRDAVAIAGLAIVGIGLFCWTAYRDPDRIVRATTASVRPSVRQVLADRDVQLNCVAGLFFSGMQVILGAYLVLYLTEAAAVPLSQAAMILAATQFSGVIARLVLGLVSDRLLGSRRRGLLLATGFTSLSLAAVAALFGQSLPLWAVTLLFLAFGFVGIGWTGVFVILSAELAGKDAAGVGSGAALSASAIGASGLPPIFGMIADATHSYQLAWAFTGLLAAIGIVTMYAVRERRDWQAARD